MTKSVSKGEDGKSQNNKGKATSLNSAGVITDSSEKRSDGQATDANGKNFYKENEVDSLNIDFQAEVRKNFSTDWDLGQPISGYSYSHVEKINGEQSWGIGNGDDKRILFNADFESTFNTRDPKKKADILWTRIESDPIKNPYTGAGVSVFNTVRQITLNFSSDNTAVYDSGENKGHYMYRPYFIFYDGPENIDYTTDSNGVLLRHSQPVVINLNADLNAIIYMPNSPVIINGNGNAWHGFIIAKCFLKAFDEDDMTKGKSVWKYDGFNAMTTFTGNYTKGTDGYGNTVYYKSADLLTKEKIEETYKDATITYDGTSGNITVQQIPKAPQYPVISFTKDLYTGCTTLAEYFAKTAEYINANYTKEKYMAYSGLSESEVSMIKFPEENETLINASGEITHNYGNFTDITIPVATADLLPSDPDPDALTKDNKYVKVMLGNEEKYIAKSKLPHMRVKRNSEYPYVCLYDLKTGLGWGLENPLVCVKPIDDSLTANDSAIVFTNSKNNKVTGSNQWGDVWVIERQLLEKNYNNNYQANKLEFAEKGGMKYFMLKSEITTEPQIVAKYYKVVLANGDVRYVKIGDNAYYMKVYNNDRNHDNYIIVDETGNILTKPITSPAIFNTDGTAVATVDENNQFKKTVETDAVLRDYWNNYTRYPNGTPDAPNVSVKPEEIPNDPGTIKNGKYVGLSSKVSRLNKDYRIPAFERVYLKSLETTFDLSEDSYYSFFNIDDLWRVNYTYLNVDENDHTVDRDPSTDWKVDDMFFTTIRAAWID